MFFNNIYPALRLHETVSHIVGRCLGAAVKSESARFYGGR